jgi:Flp pilus assembly protein protease CpaA
MINIISTIILDIAILVILLLASNQDIKTRIVPPKYQIALAVCSVANLIVKFFIVKDTSSALSCLFTGVGLFVIYILFVLIGKGGIGGADTKVSSLMALYLGFQQTILFMIAHCVVALIYTLYRFIKHKEQIKSIPLMPFLAAGFVIVRIIYWISVVI